MSSIGAAQLQALAQSSDITRSEDQTVSLEARLIQAFSHSAVSTGMEKDAILQKLEQPQMITNPAELFALQQRTSNYNLEVSMISTLTRKTVGAVESLLRS
ncbi:type III secretion system inner rod subunit SctI [Chromobacterium sphagni]|uniref:Type III secretion system protein PrgJ n=1 Tax=Chromobacterium sphagni TaxID=1903179 RepID=A0A1S1WU92_9NEIS|nr:type III secretion system inner rod subunit SctI [Chromobacterium sphagni]OHX10814.1 type III secretion system protein PrgJ [Chromobacterium sphagni]OHX19692.1 type III secretion system protein PrgJ [Chromobacterium sphagni]